MFHLLSCFCMGLGRGRKRKNIFQCRPNNCLSKDWNLRHPRVHSFQTSRMANQQSNSPVSPSVKLFPSSSLGLNIMEHLWIPDTEMILYLLNQFWHLCHSVFRSPFWHRACCWLAIEANNIASCHKEKVGLSLARLENIARQQPSKSSATLARALWADTCHVCVGCNTFCAVYTMIVLTDCCRHADCVGD